MLRLITLSGLLFLFSCSEDSGTGPGNFNNIELGTFSVDIDGSEWTATQNIVYGNVSENENFTLLSVSASKSISPTQSEAIAFTLSAEANNASALEATYALDLTGAAALAFTTVVAEDIVSYLSVSGQIVITEITESNVMGTFNATCVNTLDEEDTITMTNGAFNAAIIVP